MLEKIIKYKPKNKFEEKLLKINIFIWNLIIYSIPLNLFEFNIIKIPKEYLTFLANIIYILLRPFGEVKINENIIEYNNITFLIDKSCSGYKSILSFFAIVFATSKEFKKRIKYFLLISPILFLINIFRIFSTILLSKYFNPFFLHNILWSILSTTIVIFFWYIFYKKY